LASRVAAFSDVLGCMILSPDGLVLGSFPPGDGDGDGIKPAWLRFAGVGEPDRSFVKFPDEVWAYVRSGCYAAFAVATGTTRPVGVSGEALGRALAGPAHRGHGDRSGRARPRVRRPSSGGPPQ